MNLSMFMATGLTKLDKTPSTTKMGMLSIFLQQLELSGMEKITLRSSLEAVQSNLNRIIAETIRIVTMMTSLALP